MAGQAERPGCNVGGDLIGVEAIVEHKVEDLVDGTEGLIGCGAGLGEQYVVGRSVRRERGLGFDHVVKERDGVVDGGD